VKLSEAWTYIDIMHTYSSRLLSVFYSGDTYDYCGGLIAGGQTATLRCFFGR
jgi:hypothetical protein